MPISYTKINEGNGWTTQTSLGPTNLNHMESGIKSACDSIDTDCVQATDITPISAYELVSADVSTKAINDGNGNNIVSQFASILSPSMQNFTISGDGLVSVQKNTYCRIGKLIFLVLDLNVSSGGTLFQFYNNLPLPIAPSILNIVNWTVDTHSSEYCSITTNAINIRVPSGGRYYISGCYISE